MTHGEIDHRWLREQVSAASSVTAGSSREVDHLRELLLRCARAFADRRADVRSGNVVWPRRGLLPDEASSFLRAVDHGFATVDEAGYVSLPSVRRKGPSGRYALLSKSGDGVSVNLEYLIQIGATAELILDHGWPPHVVGFERGEFDAVAYGDTDEVVLAMEAKARVSGPDSIEKLVTEWLHLTHNSLPERATNASRKFAELQRLIERSPVLVWLVADGARWSIWARRQGATISLSPAGLPHQAVVLGLSQKEPQMLETYPYDASHHRPGTLAHDGGCSWHGRTCPETPLISFRDRTGASQSGCERAVRELVSRGEIGNPTVRNKQ